MRHSFYCWVEFMGVETQIFKDEDDRYCLSVMECSAVTESIFEDLELQGGGYTWEGIVRALIQMRLSSPPGGLEIGAEADNMYIYSRELSDLERVQELVKAADSDSILMRLAIDHAGENLE